MTRGLFVAIAKIMLKSLLLQAEVTAVSPWGRAKWLSKNNDIFQIDISNIISKLFILRQNSNYASLNLWTIDNYIQIFVHINADELSPLPKCEDQNKNCMIL